MAEQALVVLTRKSREKILAEGGTSAWSLRPGLVRQFRFAVCARNSRTSDEPGSSIPGPEPHGSAFLVGRISDVERVGERNGRDRYIVRFDAVADVNVPGLWDGSRNPVRYFDVSELAARGLKFEDLKFRPVVAVRGRQTQVDSETPRTAPLTIAEAKAGLATAFGVPVEAIQITITA